MININKPLRLVYTGPIDQCTHDDVKFVAQNAHGIIISHMMASTYPCYWFSDFDGYVSDRPWRLENVPEKPKEHTVLVRIWKNVSGGFRVSAHRPEWPLYGEVPYVAVKEITFIEGEGLKD